MQKKSSHLLVAAKYQTPDAYTKAVKLYTIERVCKYIFIFFLIIFNESDVLLEKLLPFLIN